ncbi:hypothetical protein B0A48_06605 [Cryoendolithus antarcticus]|uniref:Cyclin-like domain-containing protein n=1 Tax=Cryoendolithus antarcticus TaxID=1507870 RepID=A0A1V8T962_9PEZI|nr:hypothetical protein B0A48_06605 [Cryoendolithus antarcticus]
MDDPLDVLLTMCQLLHHLPVKTLEIFAYEGKLERVEGVIDLALTVNKYDFAERLCLPLHALLSKVVSYFDPAAGYFPCRTNSTALHVAAAAHVLDQPEISRNATIFLVKRQRGPLGEELDTCLTLLPAHFVRFFETQRAHRANEGTRLVSGLVNDFSIIASEAGKPSLSIDFMRILGFELEAQQYVLALLLSKFDYPTAEPPHLTNHSQLSHTAQTPTSTSSIPPGPRPLPLKAYASPIMPPPRRLGAVRALPGKGRKPTAPPVKKACCDSPDIQEQDGSKICKNCFTQISEANIVSDVTFEETANGGAAVQGGYIGENARHAGQLNSATFRRMGGGEKHDGAEVDRKGREHIEPYARILGIPMNVITIARNIWTLQAGHSFTSGRSVKEVAACCVYAACRRQPGNIVLLIDLAEIIKINVFRLGEVYKAMCKEIFLDENQLHYAHMIDLEALIEKYCRRLQFDEATNLVAEDALKIMRRMRRDWMTTGRHPAGLCGACIILAARMNNFKRTVREVVFVAKIADQTIAERIREFRSTKSAGLTVAQFREVGVRIKHQADPPSLHLQEERQKALERKRQKRGLASLSRSQSSPIEIADDDGSEASSTNGTPGAESTVESGRPRKRARTAADSPSPTPNPPQYDADGFAIPSQPASATPNDKTGRAPSEGLDDTPRKRGRAKRVAPPPIDLSTEEMLIEEELQNAIESALDDNEVTGYRDEVAEQKGKAAAESIGDQERRLYTEAANARRHAAGITHYDSAHYNSLESVTAEDLEAEFRDDPEVENCILSGQAAQDKEKIWLHENEDWLRAQYEKQLTKRMLEASGKDKRKTIKGRKAKKSDKLLTAAGTPAETPADINAAMLARSAPTFSKYVNYEALQRVYGDSMSPSLSRAASVAVSEDDQGSQTGEGAAGDATPVPSPSRRSNSGPATPAATQTLAPGAVASSLSAGSPLAPSPAGANTLTPPQTQIPSTQQPAVDEVAAEELIDDLDDDESEIEDDDVPERAPDDYDDYGEIEAEASEIEDEADDGDADYDAAIEPLGDQALEGAYE